MFEELRNKKKISQEEYQFYRKRILDLGNDASRELVDYSDIFFAK